MRRLCNVVIGPNKKEIIGNLMKVKEELFICIMLVLIKISCIEHFAAMLQKR